MMGTIKVDAQYLLIKSRKKEKEKETGVNNDGQVLGLKKLNRRMELEGLWQGEKQSTNRVVETETL